VRIALLIVSFPLFAQRDLGEVRIRVSDASGAPLRFVATLKSLATQEAREFESTATAVPFGPYLLTVVAPSFAPWSKPIEVRGAAPQTIEVTLTVAPVATELRVEATLIDERRVGNVQSIGEETIRERRLMQPARALLDLVQTQPGWLLEANGVLHPRGSEYDTQYVIDGFPVQDNRSPGVAPPIEVEDLQSAQVLTGSYPAEYGRKLAGVVELTTRRDPAEGWHGATSLQGGSFESASAFASLGYRRGRDAFSLSGSGATTNRFLDSVSEENFSNRGGNQHLFAGWERDVTDRDRLRLNFYRRQSRFLVPNELEQEEEGQRQDRSAGEWLGQASYQRAVSANALFAARGMVRDVTARLWSNPLSEPIIAEQDRGFREGYLQASFAATRGPHNLKFGGDAVFSAVRERFGYEITDDDDFDEGVPGTFSLDRRKNGRDVSLYAQDSVRWKRLTLNAGLRFDSYKILVSETAFSTRFGAAYALPSSGTVLHFAYDRIFQTPAIENILVSNASFLPGVAQLPVRPGRGHFFQGGVTQRLGSKVRLDATAYRRRLDNFADDETLLNTGVSIPITFARGDVHGYEAKIEVPRWGRFSGFVSYANMMARGRGPITGGLFLETFADEFAISQDQRNTLSSRLRFQASRRVALFAGYWYGSGLPVELDDDDLEELDEFAERFGQKAVDRVNFARGRVLPSWSFDVGTAATLWNRERKSVRLRADILNVTNRFNLINFAGELSGTALAPPRSAQVRLDFNF